jgi:hypothetical protein
MAHKEFHVGRRRIRHKGLTRDGDALRLIIRHTAKLYASRPPNSYLFHSSFFVWFHGVFVTIVMIAACPGQVTMFRMNPLAPGAGKLVQIVGTAITATFVHGPFGESDCCNVFVITSVTPTDQYRTGVSSLAVTAGRRASTGAGERAGSRRGT